jgi:phenylacetate-CoA ligase
LLPGEASYDAFKTQLILAESEWLERHELEEYQLGHLKERVRFAAREVPFWRARIAPDQVEDATSLADALARLPILTRDQVHCESEALRAANLPGDQVITGQASSSGSTGMVVRVATTDLENRWQKILSLRCYLWAGFDFGRALALIHRLSPGVAEYPDGKRKQRWAGLKAIPFATGPAFHLSTHASLEQQWEWLGRIRPTYLYTRPSFVRGYAKLAVDTTESTIERIMTTGEIVDPDLRTLAATKLNATIHDRYAAQETGCMAIQCPDADSYHVQSEAVIVEVLDQEGRPCRPGEIGRIVVTPLFNLATPLIRYEIGDFAEFGGACECGRSLPMLKRIMGRRRNMLVGPDGRHYWPQLHGLDFYKVSQSRQHQFRQVSPDVIEVYLVVDSPRTQAQEEDMRRIVAAALPAPFEIRFRYVSEFPRGPSDKQEELISFVADPLSMGQSAL